MRYILPTLFLTSVLILTGCDSGSDPKHQETPTDSTSYAYYPLEVGNYWVYSWYNFPNDTVRIKHVIDTAIINGMSYFLIVDSIFRFNNKFLRTDTTFVRYSADNTIVERVRDSERVYIDFNKQFVTMEGPFYPGIIFEKYQVDSSTYHRFYDCYDIIFREVEPLTITLSKNIGEVKRNGLYTDIGILISASVNGISYP